MSDIILGVLEKCKDEGDGFVGVCCGEMRYIFR